MTTLTRNSVLCHLTLSGLAYHSARCNARDLAAGRTTRRGAPKRAWLASRIRARRNLWQQWAADLTDRATIVATLRALR